MRAKRLQPDPGHRPATGIVHLGLGAFFRGFGCVYIADAMAASGGDWGIVGVSLRSAATRDALRDQGWAFTSATLHTDAVEPRVISVLNDVLVAPEDPDAVLTAMTDPAVKIVTLTVTEKGYCHNPTTGKLNLEHPDIVHDLTADQPVTAVGFLVRALQQRRAAGIAPFTVLSCDNLPENGKLARRVILDFAVRVDRELAEWILAEAQFPCAMVDRITPATTQTDIAALNLQTGRVDLAPVMHEAFSQWVIEDRFVAGQRPDFEAAGATLVPNVGAYEDMKLRLLNGTHSALAYTGYLSGHHTIAETMADPVFVTYLQTLWSEIKPAVDAPFGVDLEAYTQSLQARYANPVIRHRTWQIAMDGSQKLPQRLLATLRENTEAGRASPAICLAIAAWMRYVGGRDQEGQPIDVRDPLADKLLALSAAAETPQDRVNALLGVPEIFPEDMVTDMRAPVTLAAELIADVGMRKAVRETG